VSALLDDGAQGIDGQCADIPARGEFAHTCGLVTAGQDDDGGPCTGNHRSQPMLPEPLDQSDGVRHGGTPVILVESVLGCIEEVGRVVGAEDRAQELSASLRERIDAVRQATTRLPTIRTFCLEWLDPPFAGGHWVPEMVEMAGGENLLGEKGKSSRVVTWRQVADAQPEVVVFMPCGYYLPEAEEEGARIYGVPELRETTAFARGTVDCQAGIRAFLQKQDPPWRQARNA
jgi:hypothetical protein